MRNSRLSQTGDRFKFRIKKLGGPDFFGQILEIPDTSRVTNFLAAKRYLRTSTKTKVQARDIILVSGVKYIVGEHGDGFHLGPIYKHFKIFQAELELLWKTQTKAKDPITGIMKETDITKTQTCYMSLQPKSLEDDTVLKIGQEMLIGITNVPVKRGDVLGNDEYVVVKVTPQLGLYLIEIKEN